MRKLRQRLVPWAFERLYHEFAWAYDLVATVVSRGYWSHWIVAVAPLLHGERVLEVGCGTGHLQLALARGVVPHVGYDVSPQMLRLARRRLRRAGATPRLLRGRAQALPFATDSFSDVVATFPARYILERTTLAEIRRVLRAEGQLLIVDGGRLGDGGIYEAAVDLAYRATQVQTADGSYRHALEQAGFAVEERRLVVGRSTVGVVIARPSGDADRRL